MKTYKKIVHRKVSISGRRLKCGTRPEKIRREDDEKAFDEAIEKYGLMTDDTILDDDGGNIIIIQDPELEDKDDVLYVVEIFQ